MNEHLREDTNLLNLNSNMLSAIDIRTTGPMPKRDSIIEICILPVNAELKPHKKILPFNVDLQPLRPDLIDFDNLPRGTNRMRIFKVTQAGMHPFIAADRFEMWFNKIQFKWQKKLSPLAHNWLLKREFLIDWLGHTVFDNIFDYRYRDPIPAALFANDRADFAGEQIEYPKQNFAHLASQLKVEHERSPDTLQHCISLIEVYRRMLKTYI